MTKLSEQHRVIGTTIDVLALLAIIEDSRRVIFCQAFHEGSWDSVFDEAHAMGKPIKVLRALMIAVIENIENLIAGNEAPTMDEMMGAVNAMLEGEVES